MKIELTHDTILDEDIDALCEWLQTKPRLTKGDETKAFEEEFAKYIGSKYAVYVNSGSSANLLMLSAIKPYLKNKKVIIPIICWSTDLAPINQLGLEPVYVGYDDNLQPSPDDIENALRETGAAAVLCVSILGLVPQMQKIKDICEKYGAVLIEDNCESLGAESQFQKLGSFGLMSSFSFYYSHHISTIEGGMITTSNREVWKELLMLRSHGWVRDLPEEDKKNIDKFKGMYTFYRDGYNLRNTDLGAFIGRRQLKLVDKIANQRNQMFYLFNRLCDTNVFEYKNTQGDKISSFAVPFILKEGTNAELSEFLLNKGIENRPLVCGDIRTQPFAKKTYNPSNDFAAFFIERNEGVFYPDSILENKALYLPNHCGLNDESVRYMVETIKEFYETSRKK